MLEVLQNLIIQGPHQKPIAIDVYYTPSEKLQPIVIFSHGFKGFKDWGPFPLVSQYFAEQGFVFIKFNFSHNGTSPEAPDQFVDLDAFGRNNFLIELDDLKCVIDWCLEERQYKRFHGNPEQLYLLGHSRGAATALLKAIEDTRIKKIATWAPVHDPERFFGDEKTIAYWKNTGVLYVENMRTRQQMPLYWQFYESYFKHRERLHLPTRIQNLKIPFFIAHGTQDDTIPYVASLELHSWIPQAQFFCVEAGGHTFGGSHPWAQPSIPEDCIKVVQATSAFFRENS